MDITLDQIFLGLAIIAFVLAIFAVPSGSVLKGGWVPVGLLFVALFLWP